jgi:hypothetical protein
MKAMELYSINLNRSVYTEVTERGWQSMRNYYNNIFQGLIDVEPYIEMKKRNDTEEYVIGGEKKMLTKFQIHELMQVFGDSDNFYNDGREPWVKGLKLYFNLKEMKQETDDD